MRKTPQGTGGWIQLCESHTGVRYPPLPVFCDIMPIYQSLQINRMELSLKWTNYDTFGNSMLVFTPYLILAS